MACDCIVDFLNIFFCRTLTHKDDCLFLFNMNSSRLWIWQGQQFTVPTFVVDTVSTDSSPQLVQILQILSFLSYYELPTEGSCSPYNLLVVWENISKFLHLTSVPNEAIVNAINWESRGCETPHWGKFVWVSPNYTPRSDLEVTTYLFYQTDC